MIKTFTIAAATTIVLASSAAANNSFSFNNMPVDGSTVELGQVQTESGGVVSIYDYHAGEQGVLLGTEELTAGANYDVRVTLDQPPFHNVLAVLTVNGQVVDTQELESTR